MEINAHAPRFCRFVFIVLTIAFSDANLLAYDLAFSELAPPSASANQSIPLVEDWVHWQGLIVAGLAGAHEVAETQSEAPHATLLCADISEANPTRETRDISGWQVHIAKSLLETEAEDTAKALAGLKSMLDEIVRELPSTVVADLKKVPLYFSPTYKPGRSGAEFHPDAGWLRDNGRDPRMAQGVEFSGVHDFEAEMRRMPNFALHELAHAFHFRVLPDGFGNAEISSAFQRAKRSGTYDRVERSLGNGGPPTVEQAYALTNAMEYFAETTEAYFSRNDFFPFTRDELLQHDPEMHALLERLWGVSASK